MTLLVTRDGREKWSRWTPTAARWSGSALSQMPMAEIRPLALSRDGTRLLLRKEIRAACPELAAAGGHVRLGRPGPAASMTGPGVSRTVTVNGGPMASLMCSPGCRRDCGTGDGAGAATGGNAFLLRPDAGRLGLPQAGRATSAGGSGVRGRGRVTGVVA